MQTSSAWKNKTAGMLTILVGVVWCGIVIAGEVSLGFLKVPYTIKANAPGVPGILLVLCVMGNVTYDIQQAKSSSFLSRFGRILSVVGATHMILGDWYEGMYPPTYAFGLFLIGMNYIRILRESLYRGFPAFIGSFSVCSWVISLLFSDLTSVIMVLNFGFGLCWVILGYLIWKTEAQK